MSLVMRERKSKFIKLFDKTPEGVVCPHFYELILSNGCPYDCAYCYLKLTLRYHGGGSPILYNNDWDKLKRELNKSKPGVYSTGELADSLAIEPPLLDDTINYFQSNGDGKYILLTTKSDSGYKRLGSLIPSNNIIVSYSVNSSTNAVKYENKTPSPENRITDAKKLREEGFRVRIRIDPIIYEDFEEYREVCEIVSDLNPERVTIGTLRHYPQLLAFAEDAPKEGLEMSWDGRLRYSIEKRLEIYSRIAEWLGFQPALCKETEEVWEKLGWKFEGCNCTE
jgi:spore photoproduct lyase